MPYGTIKIDTVTFTDGGVDKSVSISGLVQNPTFSGNVTITGTISGNLVRGQTVSGVIVTGTTATFSTGIFTSLTGTTSQGTTATYTSGGFTSLTGVTTSGTTANFVSGVFSTQLSGATITGNVGAFTTLTGGVTTLTSGVFAAGSAASPSITFTGDLNTGIYSPGADQVAISTNGTGRLFVNASGLVGIGTTSPGVPLTVQADSNAFANDLIGRAADNTSIIRFKTSDNSTALGSIGQYGTTMNINSIGAGPIAFYTTNTERARIDSSGRLLVGTSSAYNVGGFQRSNYFASDDNEHVVISAAGGFGPYPAIYFTKTRAATPGAATTAVADGDKLGAIEFYGANGTDFSNIAGWITCEVDGQPFTSGDTTDLPGRLVFSTTADGASSPTERMRIASAGNVGIGTTSPARTLQIQATSASFGISNTGGDSLAIDPPTGGFAQIDVSGANALRFNTNGSERARIDSSGRLLVGTSSARETNTGNDPFVQFERSSGSALVLSATKNGADAFGPYFTLIKSRGTSAGANNLVSSGDELGSILFYGTDGTNPEAGAAIQAYVDGTPGANDMPGRLVFSTTADGASSPTERMRITNKGACKITEDGGIRDADSSYHELRNNLNSEVVVIETASSSYTSFMQRNNCYTAASSSYTFFDAHSGNFSDREFHLRGDGNAFADGTWSGGGADYAEFFEWSDSNPNAEDRRGISVVLDGDKIREAVAGEDPIGVISGNPSVVGDSAWNKWSGKYLRDEFGTYIQEDYEVADDDGNTVIQQRRKLNPAYDPDVEYISREQRPEWDCVGLMGKLRIRKGQVTGSRWIKMRDINDSVEEWLVR